MLQPIHRPLIERIGVDADRPALVWSGGTMTHGQLRDRVVDFARRLSRRGVKRGDRVVICLPKSHESVVAILGTSAAGAIYVPIDASQPVSRTVAMIADADPAAVVANAKAADALRSSGWSIDRLLVETGDLPRRTDVSAASLPNAELDDAAAILYTSGSTGEPKGVVLSHRNIMSFVQWAIDRFALTADDRFCSHARFHFDLSTLDLFAPLALGASVFLIDDGMLAFPAEIARTADEQRVTVWYSTPTALRLLVDRGGLDRRSFEALRLVLFAGEVFPNASFRRLMAALPGPRFVNLYGPTETNVCTYHIVSAPPRDKDGPIPIGVAREDLSVGVLGEHDRPVAIGEVGELCVAGPAVMLGYWRRPEATAASRVAGRADSYRTGDLATVDGEGRFRFVGRRDDQVKIRGTRVELGEVEAHLAAHPMIRQAAVVTFGEPGDLLLVAFISTADGVPLESVAVRRYCAERLVAAAVPGDFVFLRELPTTSTGKIDRRGLTTHRQRDTMRAPQAPGHGLR